MNTTTTANEGNSAMKKQYQLLLWVSNMSVVGADSDYTENYLDAAGAAEIAAKHGVALDGQTISADDTESLWSAFRAIAQAVAAAGHGDDTDGEDVPAPTLTARLPWAEDAAASLQEVVSQTATTWESWRKEALVSDEEMRNPEEEEEE